MTLARPAHIYATLAGSLLTSAGVVGFFYSATFTDNPAVRADALGAFAVNGWHNVLHLLTGVLGLTATPHTARAFALGLGVVYLGAAIWGFALAGGHPSILGIVPVGTGDDTLHLAIGALGIGAGLATRAQVPPRGATSA